MGTKSPTQLWPLIYSVIQGFWSITEPHISDAGVREEIPVELYFYSELGLDYFSIEAFQKRDPFSNPEQFERLFARLNIKGWIEPLQDKSYRVTDRARAGARLIIQAGDKHLSGFQLMSEVDLERLAELLGRVVAESRATSEPPVKWAIINRFRVADKDSPWLVQVREYLMDLFAYRDDSHLSAARPHFNRAGIVWSVLGSLWTGEAPTPEKIAERQAFRGYEVDDYRVAIQAAVGVGWVEQADAPGKFRPTQMGRELRQQVEQLTDEYFYRPWSVFTQAELDELYNLLKKLREELDAYGKSR
jgi:helix-turn-helix protein